VRLLTGESVRRRSGVRSVASLWQACDKSVAVSVVSLWHLWPPGRLVSGQRQAALVRHPWLVNLNVFCRHLLTL